MSETRTSTTLRNSGAERAPAPKLPAGATLGRYVVLTPLGEGGMGVVYAAYDYGLERKVALKVVRSDGGEAGTAQRLLREAQAMARLNHPNIATVYDVSTTTEQPFVAMELVDGGTLAQWLDAPRSQREVVRVLSLAGEGLAAAHAVGVVHGDFKPHNVLIGHHGLVRVTDFGLARLVREGGDAKAPSLQGTLRYMAPELLDGGRATTASDQFAFCVSLHEALFGAAPFVGEGVAALRESMSKPPALVGPKAGTLSPRLRRVLVRGLSPSAEARFPSMRALLDELAPRTLGRRAVWSLGALGAAALVALGFSQGRAVMARRCLGAGAPAATLWNDARRAELGAAFDAAKSQSGPQVLSRLDRHLSDYQRRWHDAAVATCESTQESAGPVFELKQRKERCLSDGLREARTLVETVLKADAEAIVRSTQAAAALPSPFDCTEAAFVQGLVYQRAPTERSSRIESALDEVRARAALGQYALALERVTPLVDEARESNDLRVLARARVEQGVLLERVRTKNDLAIEALLDGVVLAEEAGDDAMRARAHIELMLSRGLRRGEYAAARHHAREARAIINRLGRPPRLELDLLARELQGEFEPAKSMALGRAAIAFGEKALGPDDPSVLMVTVMFAVKLVDFGHLDEAKPLVEACRERIARTLGPRHPSMQMVLKAATGIARESRDFEAALASARELQALRLEFAGPDHERAVVTHFDLGGIFMKMGDLEKALAEAQACVAGLHRTGSHGLNWAAAHNNLGEVLRLLGRTAEAVAALEIAANAYRETTMASQTAQALASLAWARIELGDLQGAELSLAQAIERCGPPVKDGVCTARTRGVLAKLRLARKQPAKAREELERAVAATDEHDLEGLSMAQFQLAELLSPTVAEVPQRALELARASRAGYQTEGAFASQVNRIDAWLAARTQPIR